MSRRGSDHVRTSHSRVRPARSPTGDDNSSVRAERPDLPVHDVGLHDVGFHDVGFHEVGFHDVSGHDLPVHDVSSSGHPAPVSDTVEFGGSPRVSGLLTLGVVAVATVASIVLIANRTDDHRTATPMPRVINTLPSPTAPLLVSAVPPAPASSLVEGRTTCFQDEPGHGASISFGIRNRLSHAVVVERVSFAPQRGVGVSATSIGINPQSPSNCPAARDLHPAGQYRVPPGPVWISVRLTSTPACGTELRSAWLVSFTDRGQTHQVRFVGTGITTNCPPRSHFSHGRYGLRWS